MRRDEARERGDQGEMTTLPFRPGVTATAKGSELGDAHLRNPDVDKPAHLLALIEHLLLGTARVDDKDGVVNCNRGLGDVGRDHHLP